METKLFGWTGALVPILDRGGEGLVDRTRQHQSGSKPEQSNNHAPRPSQVNFLFQGTKFTSSAPQAEALRPGVNMDAAAER